MATHDELEEMFSRVERFLNQQRELYGDPLPLVEEGLPAKQPQAVESAGPTAAGTSMKKNPTAQEQKNLFGEPESAPLSAGQAQAAYPDEPWTAAQSLEHLDAMINTCTKCALGTTRTNFVFGVGNPKAGLVLVGEAPGADEDAQGEPFVGRAGQLLNKILEAINFRREEVYICNILKCRPPNNREPQPDEVALCEPYLWKQIDLIKPKVILCLGRVAAQVLLKTNDALGVMRERLYDYRGAKVVVTYHPAALLRNPHWKRPAWEDVQKARKLYDELMAGQNPS
jgi:uracil-DNA glycosylase